MQSIHFDADFALRLSALLTPARTRTHRRFLPLALSVLVG